MQVPFEFGNQINPGQQPPPLMIADYLEQVARDLRMGRKGAVSAIVILAGEDPAQVQVESLNTLARSPLDAENAVLATLARAIQRLSIPMA